MNDVKSITVEEMLDQLTEVVASKARLEKSLQTATNKIIPAEIAEQLNDAQMQHYEEIATCDMKEQKLREQIKTAVLLLGETVAGDNMQAVYADKKGTWNHDMLLGICVMKPEILQAYTPGEPYVSIKKK